MTLEPRRYSILVGGLAALCLAAILFSLGRDAETRVEWQSQQRAFFALKGQDAPLGVRSLVTRWREGQEVDRCTTCHLGASDASLASSSVPAQFRAHPFAASLFRKHLVETFGCASCHRGVAGATDASAHTRGELERVAGGVRWSSAEVAEPMLRGGTLVDILVDADNDTLEAKVGAGEWSKAVLADGKPRLYASEADLFAAIETQLPMLSVQKHHGRVTLAAVDKGAQLSWRMKPGLAAMLGFDAPSSGAPAASHTARLAPSVPVRSAAEGLRVPEEFLDRFVAALPEVESGCGRCHTRDDDLRAHRSRGRWLVDRLAFERGKKEDPGPDPEAREDVASTFTTGRHLFEDLACAGCHEEHTRDSAPPLGDLLTKRSPSWILEFLRGSRVAGESRTMPNFWPPPIDPRTKATRAQGSPEYAAWEKARRDETLDVAAFLVEASTPAQEATVRGRANVPGSSAEEGAELFAAYGCRACHQAVPSNLKEDWTAYYLEDPSRLWAGGRMPSFRLTRRESASLAKYVTRPAAPPRDAGPSELENKAFRAETAPCAAAEGASLSRAACGEKIIGDLGCTRCHAIPGAARADKFAPPLDAWGVRSARALDFGEAMTRSDRTREMFAVWKLDAPRLFEHPGNRLKMPDYDLSAAEIRALTVYLEGRVGAPPPAPFDPYAAPAYADISAGRALLRRLSCASCHVIDDDGAPDTTPAARPGPSLVGEGIRVQPEWLVAFLKQPGALGVRPKMHPEWVYGELAPTEKLAPRMPSYALSSAEVTALVAFFARWDGGDYPYSDLQRKPLSPADTLAALRETNAASCMGCHFLGAFPVERGKTELAKLAPDLGGVAKRLRPEWVSAWLARPGDWTMPLHPKSSEAEIDRERDFLFMLRDKTRLPRAGDEAHSPILGLGP